MTIRYSNGQVFEAVLLSRTEGSLRVAIQGSDDVQELTQINGTWVSDDCEPVQGEFAWTRRGPVVEVTEEDCICSHELAARLIRILFAGENESETKTMAVGMPEQTAVYHHVV